MVRIEYMGAKPHFVSSSASTSQNSLATVVFSPLMSTGQKAVRQGSPPSHGGMPGIPANTHTVDASQQEHPGTCDVDVCAPSAPAVIMTPLSSSAVSVIFGRQETFAVAAVFRHGLSNGSAILLQLRDPS